MSVYWNVRTKNLSPYIPGEQPKDRKFIKLNTNENPYPPSPKVIEAIQKAADENLRLYPDPQCCDFREAAAARYGVRPEEVLQVTAPTKYWRSLSARFLRAAKKPNRYSFQTLPIVFIPFMPLSGTFHAVLFHWARIFRLTPPIIKPHQAA